MGGLGKVRMTVTTQLVLQLLLDDPAQETYGLAIAEAAGLPSGTIHPILARLEQAGWVESHWEQVDPRAEKRPRRRYYRLSALGAEQARQVLEVAHATRPWLFTLRPRAVRSAS
ncbi:hypothetical protein ACTI_74480 [Actinoplanes sp. OR16]|uniref:PadR family transcriptional regulator n=1 Tax=Actinoplanes sp. OR16 TaxID=946334 RepID=UPI000F6B9E0F|nr:helix-turn-helix transcriptional regulator [Actinoplanes sp. OR16]BBH70763.1 hypothetical protein ACTI_74480 [Actinoplanes sp. OR16]